jgi:O-antigen ligase
MIHLYRHGRFFGWMRYFFLDRYYNLTIRVLLILTCLGTTLVSTFLFNLINEGQGLGLILGLVPVLAIVGITGLVFVYTNMELFGLMVFAISILVNDGIPTGSGTKATFTFVLLYLWLFMWFFKMIVVERNFRLRPSPVNIPIFIFIIIVIISLVWSSTYSEPSVAYLLDSKIFPRLMTTLVLIISPLTYIFYANHIRHLRSLHFVTWFFIGAGAVYLALRLWLDRIPKPFNAEGQFPTWVGVIALGQLLFNKELKLWMRGVLGVIIAGWFYVTMTLGVSWLSGWLPLLAGFAAVTFFFSRKLFILGMVAAIGFYIFAYAGIQENFERENEESGGTRSEAWQRVFDLTGRHILFGTGPAGYHFYFTVNISGLFQLSHNNYVDIVGQTGVVGFTAWILLWGCMGLVMWRLYRVIPLMGGGFQKGLAYALLASYPCTLLTMALGDWVTPFPYTQTLQGIDYTIWAWIIPGLATAMYYITLENAKVTKASLSAESNLLLDNNAPQRHFLPPLTNH